MGNQFTIRPRVIRNWSDWHHGRSLLRRGNPPSGPARLTEIHQSRARSRRASCEFQYAPLPNRTTGTVIAMIRRSVSTDFDRA